MTCTAKIRPLTDGTELQCKCDDEQHVEHHSTLRDYAWPGSATTIYWQEDDRRNFRGEWRPCTLLVDPACTLPAGHRRNCAP